MAKRPATVHYIHGRHEIVIPTGAYLPLLADARTVAEQAREQHGSRRLLVADIKKGVRQRVLAWAQANGQLAPTE
jgi:hypothetical protein